MDYQKYWQKQRSSAYYRAHKCTNWAAKTLPQYREWWLDQAEGYRQQARKYAKWAREYGH